MNFTVLIFGALSSHCPSLHHRCWRRLLTISNTSTKPYQIHSTKTRNVHAMLGKQKYHWSLVPNLNQSKMFPNQNRMNPSLCLYRRPAYIPRNKTCRFFTLTSRMLVIMVLVPPQRRWQRNASFIDACFVAGLTFTVTRWCCTKMSKYEYSSIGSTDYWLVVSHLGVCTSTVLEYYSTTRQ